MNRKILASLLLCMLAWMPSASGAPLVADLSTYRIDMDAYFSGTRLFLFGARNDAGDVVAIIRGPTRDFILRKKESFAGLWINRGRMKFFGVPAFYAVAASRKLEEIAPPALLSELGIGERALLAPPSDPKLLNDFTEYAPAFLDYQRRQKLYSESEMVKFMGETLFKMAIDFPDNIPPGHYTAEIYLINDAKIVGMQAMPIDVVKTGLDAWLYTVAHERPALYGAAAVLLALGIGWAAGRIFEKI